MYYLQRTPLYDAEKPYTMRYQPDEEEGIPQTNFVKVKKPLTVRSMRHCSPQPGSDSDSENAGVTDKSGTFKLEECGFQKIRLESQLTYEEFWDNEKVQKTYVQEVKSALKRELGAKYVFVLDYAVSIYSFTLLSSLSCVVMFMLCLYRSADDIPLFPSRQEVNTNMISLLRWRI
jgi:hypothetical protein